MTKEDLLQLANNLADGERVCGVIYTKFDVDWDKKDADEEEFSAVEWERFCHWFDKYQDCASDYDEAMYFATKERDEL